jgi:hypothetical protein
MAHFRPVLTLLVVISTVGGQFSTLSAQTKITIGYAAVSPRNKESSRSTASTQRLYSSAARRPWSRVSFPAKWKWATPAARRW